jgi:hypothetical protein
MAVRSTRVRLVVSVVATVVILAPLAWLWQSSLVGSSYSVMGMGTLDYGGGPVDGHGHGSTDRSITDLVGDSTRKADVRVDLVAEQQNLAIGGRSVAGYSLNGTSPGPTITAHQGQLIEVHLRNASVKAGITLHWHGYDVPAAMDGVAGVTQDEVPIGGEFTYRFVANQIGTYWYHSHQVSNPQVIGGLFGTLLVSPRSGKSEPVDVIATAHTYEGMKTINGVAGDLRVPAKPGQRVRIRVINTDNGPIETWADTPFRVLATDGYDVNAPIDVTDRSMTVTAGGRADLGIMMPSDGSAVRVQVSKGTAVILGAEAPPALPQPASALDLLGYGTPTALGIDLQVGRLLVVDWMPPHLGWDDAIEMIFDGGTVDENDLAFWSLEPTEIKAVALVDLATATLRWPSADSAWPSPSVQTRWPTPRRAVRPDLQACAHDRAACGSELAELQAYVLQCHG